MFELRSFALEDFFHQYEHRQGLLNLASSDAYPWTLLEMIALCPRLQQDVLETNLKYPDMNEALLPSLESFCKPPSGMGVLAVSGAAEAIFLVLTELRCRSDLGLRIAVPLPSYGAFEGISRLLGCEIAVYKYRPEAEWSLDRDELKRLCAKSDVVVVNNPHNPTGHLIDNRFLEEISDLVKQNEGTLLVDEVFRLLEDCPTATQLGRHVTVIGSLSKVYGLPGLRLGWIVSDAARLARLRSLQQYTTLSPNSFAVVLGTVVLDHIDCFSRRRLLQINRRIVEQWAANNADVLRVISSPAGTTAVLEINSSAREDDLFKRFLDKGVLLVPGSRCFAVNSSKPWFRLGYGAHEDVLRQGLKAVTDVLTRP